MTTFQIIIVILSSIGVAGSLIGAYLDLRQRINSGDREIVKLSTMLLAMETDIKDNKKDADGKVREVKGLFERHVKAFTEKQDAVLALLNKIDKKVAVLESRGGQV